MKTRTAPLAILVLLIVCTIASCKKKDPDPVTVPYAQFRINGVSTSYYHWDYFGKDVCPWSTYCGDFYYYENQGSINSISVGIPGTPIIGHTYKSGESRFKFFYFDNTGKTYTEESANFALTIIRWEGQGGWVSASYSGWLKNRDNLSDSLYMDQGKLLSKIWTYVNPK